MHRDHQPIAGNLCDHRRGRDASRNPVALPDSKAGRTDAGHRKSIGQDISRADAEPGHRAPHALDVGLVQTDAVDLGGRNHHRGPGKRAGDNLRVDAFAGRRREQLGVGQSRHLTASTGRQHHSADDERAGAGASAGFVSTGHRIEPSLGQAAFVGVQAPHRSNPIERSQPAGDMTRAPAPAPAAATRAAGPPPVRRRRQRRRSRVRPADASCLSGVRPRDRQAMRVRERPDDHEGAADHLVDRNRAAARQAGMQRESAESLRWSPSTHNRPGGTVMSNGKRSVVAAADTDSSRASPCR